MRARSLLGGSVACVLALSLVWCSSSTPGAPVPPAEASAPDTAPPDSGTAPSDAPAPQDSGVVADTGVDAGRAPMPCDAQADCERIVFISSGVYSGALGGIAGADAKCNQLAKLSRSDRVKQATFAAWISSTASNVSARVTHGTSRYALVDGTTIADSWTDLTKGSIKTAITRDESGDPLAFELTVWTGSTAAGVVFPPECSAWTTDLTSGTYGTTASTVDWSYTALQSCNATKHIYCVEK